MTLTQLQHLKHWHLAHRHRAPMELAVCDTVLCAWVAGWFLMPTLLAVGEWGWLPASLSLVLMPEAYHALRARLHRRGVLRCEWLGALRSERG